jgi:hypothetical protein
MDICMTSRNLQIVAGVLGFIGTLYAVMAAMCIVRHDSYRSLVAFLVFNVSAGFSLSAWLKAGDETGTVPEWLRVSCYLLACSLFVVAFSR